MVFVLAGVLVAMFLLTALQSMSLSAPLSNSSLADGGMLSLWPMLQDRWQMLRVVWASFLHLDVGHLASNLVMLLFLGPPVERYFGRWVFLAQTLALSVAWSAVVLWMDPTALTVGFSGVIFGYIGLQGFVALQEGLSLRPTLVFMLLNLVFTVITPGVSLWGHIGGGIAGVLLGGAYFALARSQAHLSAVMTNYAPIAVLFMLSAGAVFARVSTVMPAGVH